jgi:hypothetical protein
LEIAILHFYSTIAAYSCPFRYNTALSRVRVGVEQVFGRWKRRFHSLHEELRIKLESVPNFIIACAVLHNIAIDRRLPDFQPCECADCVSRRQRNNNNDDVEDMPQVDFAAIPGAGTSYNVFRQQIVDSFFTN